MIGFRYSFFEPIILYQSFWINLAVKTMQEPTNEELEKRISPAIRRVVEEMEARFFSLFMKVLKRAFDETDVFAISLTNMKRRLGKMPCRKFETHWLANI